MAEPGDVVFDQFMIGSMNMMDPSVVKWLELNIYEDILENIFTADVEVLDENDALGTYMLSGKEDVTISYYVPGIDQSVNLSMKLFSMKDLDDGTVDNKGAMKHKKYSLRMVSPELLMNQSINLQRSFNKPTSSIVQEVLGVISSINVLTPDPTNGNQRLISNGIRPLEFLESIKDRHVSMQFLSSAYVTYRKRQGGNENYQFCTFEYLMSLGSKMLLKQDPTIGGRTTTESDGMTQLLWFQVPDTFHTPTRYAGGSNRNTYNMHTGVQFSQNRDVDDNFVLLGFSTFSAAEKGIVNSIDQLLRRLRITTIDPANDTTATGIAQAAVNRAAFMAHLTQNAAQFEIHGNPDITVGDVVTLLIPKKADASWSEGENEINDDVLITRLRHRIRTIVEKPQYTMICEGVKAAFAQPVT